MLGFPLLVGAVWTGFVDKQKKSHLAATLFCFWWRRREFESSLRSTDLRFASATRAFSCVDGQTKRPPAGWPFRLLVEAAGVEPASASTLPLALHA